MATTTKKKYTIADLEAMPDDGTERWTINGELRETPPLTPGLTMTVRGRFHSRVMSQIDYVLQVWRRSQPEPWGEVITGEAGIRLPDTDGDMMGVDVAYVPPEVLAIQPADAIYIEGTPTLCVEILSPTDQYTRMNEKTRRYLDEGVSVVWVVDPFDQTVVVSAKDRQPVIYNCNQQIPEHPSMPEFAPRVADLFR